MRVDESCVGAVLSSSSARTPDCATDPDDLRARAGRYRSLAETLTDIRVIAVVQACARELELEAMSSRQTMLLRESRHH
jgi:hypothetical protein